MKKQKFCVLKDMKVVLNKYKIQIKKINEFKFILYIILQVLKYKI